MTTAPTNGNALNPDFFLGPKAAGGPTPSGAGPGPTGGWLAEIHGDEWVLPAHARAAIGDRALWEMTKGRSFAGGGFIDAFGNPVTPGAAPGPAGGVATPTGYANGAIGSIADSFLSSVGGPFGGILGGIVGAGQPSGAAADSGGISVAPGLAGLAQAGGDPGKLDAWGKQTGDWLGTFGAQTLTSFGSTLWQGLLGLVGLENSILSPSNTYTSAALKGAGFFLGDDGPLVPGGQGVQGTGARPATDKQLREGQQGVDRADQRVDEIMARIAEMPSDVKGSQRLSLDNDLANARQDAADARADLSGLQSRGGSTMPMSLAALPQGVGSEKGLQTNTIAAKRAISAAFPEITDIGGYRQDPLKWHPNGLAIDVMIPGGDTAGGANPSGKALGDRIAAFVNANKDALNVDYVMWQVKDHFNHLHVNTTGGGYPKGYSGGGAVPGVGMGDTVPAMLTPDEHVLTTRDVAALGGQAGVYAMRDALHMAGGGAVPFPTAAAIRPRPPAPRPNFRVPDVAKIAPPPRPPATLAPVTPPRAPASVAPGPDSPLPTPPVELAPSARDNAPRPTAPVGGPAPVAGPPSSYDHNLPAVNTAISSAASTIGAAAQTAATLGVGGGLGGGGGGPSIQGLFQLGGKAVSGLVNVGSSLLVGNVTPGTTDNAYGETLRPPQKDPVTAAVNGGNSYVFNGIDSRRVVDEIRIKDAQDGQARLARYP